jgi:hypothetical protein
MLNTLDRELSYTIAIQRNKVGIKDRGRTMLEKPRKTEKLTELDGYFSPM